MNIPDRIDSEFSSLLFERGALPADVPEMKTAADFILKKAGEKDPEILLQSTGAGEDASEEADASLQEAQ